MWECVINTNDLIQYDLIDDNIKICIEARKNNHSNYWEIFKTYHLDNITFTEDFETSCINETNRLIEKLKKNILSKKELLDLNAIKKNLEIKIKRSYKTNKVEKWKFAINSNNFTNIIIEHQESDRVEYDIMIDETFKYLESEILDELIRILGQETDKEIVQNVFFFSKRNSSSYINEECPLDDKFEIGLRIENKDGFNENFIDN